MDYLLAGALFVLLMGCVVYLSFRLTEQRHRYPAGSFGKTKEARSHAERNALVEEYLRQQRSSFALLWVTIALGTVLTVGLIGSVLFAGYTNSKLVSLVVGILGDLGLGKGAFNLYRAASQRLERILKDDAH